MKYIKSYKIFESSDEDEELIEDIRDLLVDLEDQGFIIDVAKTYVDGENNSFNVGSILVYIYKKIPLHETDVDQNDEDIENLFEYSDVEFYVNRLISFMKSKKFNIGFSVLNPKVNKKIFTEVNREIENNLRLWSNGARLVLKSCLKIEFMKNN